MLPANLSIPAINYLFPLALIVLTFQYRKEKAFRHSLIIVSIFCGVQLLINWIYPPIIFSEILWSLQYLKIFTIFWTAYYLWSEQKQIACYVLDIAFVSLVIINALQLMEFQWVLNAYAPSVNYKNEILFSVMDSRVFGSFLNPNNNALALLLFTVAYLFSNKKMKWSYVILGAVLIFLTQSRTVFLLMVLSMVVFVFQKYRMNLKRVLFIGAAGSLLLFIALYFFKFDYIQMLLDGRIFSSNSFIVRTEAASAVFEVNKEQVVLGQGKVPNIPDLIGYSIDNQFMYLYLEYGLLGILSFLSIITYILIAAIKKRSTSALLIVGVLLLAGLSNLSFSNSELIAIYTFILAGSFFLNDKLQVE